MPLPEPVHSRRAVVAGLAGLSAVSGLTLAGCSSDSGLSLPDLSGEPSAPDPDRGLTRRVRDDEQQVLDLVDATVSRHRSLRGPLRSARRAHAAHLALLTPDGARRPSDRGSRRSPHVAGDPGRALAAVVDAEHALTRRHAASAVRAQSGPLARVVASMSAAAAQQATALGSVDVGRGRRS